MEKKKEEKEAYATEDPTDTSAKNRKTWQKRQLKNSNHRIKLNFH